MMMWIIGYAVCAIVIYGVLLGFDALHSDDCFSIAVIFPISILIIVSQIIGQELRRIYDKRQSK